MEKLNAAIREAVRQKICEVANEEIKKASQKFECEMGKAKAEMVGKIVNAIEIRCKHEIPGEYVVQVNLRGVGNGR